VFFFLFYTGKYLKYLGLFFLPFFDIGGNGEFARWKGRLGSGERQTKMGFLYGKCIFSDYLRFFDVFLNVFFFYSHFWLFLLKAVALKLPLYLKNNDKKNDQA